MSRSVSRGGRDILLRSIADSTVATLSREVGQRVCDESRPTKGRTSDSE